MRYTRLTPSEFHARSGLDDWRVLLRCLHAEFAVGSYANTVPLVAGVAELAEAADHHPELRIRYPDRVHVTLTTHAINELSTKDAELAQQISALAQRLGARSMPSALQYLEAALDTMDAERIRPFWKAVLGYEEAGDGSLYDPLGLSSPLWFQQMDKPRTERNRFHFDIVVPHDQAQTRISAALGAGGRLVSDRYARSFWILADVEGNEVCVCTWQDREH